MKNTCKLDVMTGETNDPRFSNVCKESGYAISLDQIYDENDIYWVREDYTQKWALPEGTYPTSFKDDMKKIQIQFWARPVLELEEKCQDGSFNDFSKQKVIKTIDKIKEPLFDPQTGANNMERFARSCYLTLT